MATFPSIAPGLRCAPSELRLLMRRTRETAVWIAGSRTFPRPGNDDEGF